MWQTLEACGGGGMFPHLSEDDLTEEQSRLSSEKEMTSQEDRRTGQGSDQGQLQSIKEGGLKEFVTFQRSKPGLRAFFI